MPRLRELVVPHCSQYWTDLPLILYFRQYPNIVSLKLSFTFSFSPVAPCASLRHLELTCCTLRPQWPEAVSSTRSVYDALELFPSLETLSLSHLSVLNGDRLVDIANLSKTVHLPRLRLLEMEDVSLYIQSFLSHLVFPPTTSLVFNLNYGLTFEDPPSVPVFPGLNPSPSPDAEISLHINFLHFVDPSLVHPEGLTRWETHGAGVRRVHITLIGAVCNLGLIVCLTSELAHALAPPPGRGVTGLTATGTWARSPDDRHPQAHHLLLCAWEYWTAFLPHLAGLRRLTCTGLGATKDFIDVLGRPLPRSGEFPCPRLAELTLVWHLSREASQCFEVEQGGHGQARGDVDVEHDHDDEPISQDVVDGARAGHASPTPASLSPSVTVSLGELCDTLGACLAKRVGRCKPIWKLSITLRGWCDEDLYVKQWQAALAEQQLQDGLGPLVGEVAVVDVVEPSSFGYR
ncbi:hypothetical protein V8D89_012325 [Ganoderma adspersum]